MSYYNYPTLINKLSYFDDQYVQLDISPLYTFKSDVNDNCKIDFGKILPLSSKSTPETRFRCWGSMCNSFYEENSDTDFNHDNDNNDDKYSSIIFCSKGMMPPIAILKGLSSMLPKNNTLIIEWKCPEYSREGFLEITDGNIVYSKSIDCRN